MMATEIWNSHNSAERTMSSLHRKKTTLVTVLGKCPLFTWKLVVSFEICKKGQCTHNSEEFLRQHAEKWKLLFIRRQNNKKEFNQGWQKAN